MPRARETAAQYAPAQRLAALKRLLQSTGGLTVREMIERLAISRATAFRYLKALGETEPLVEAEVEGRKVWRLLPTASKETVRLSRAEMVALFLSMRVFDCLAGTGFKEDLDAVYERLATTLKKSDAALATNLDRKIFDVNEGRHLYEGRTDLVDDALTALLYEERLLVTRAKPAKDRTPFLFEPYSLLFHRKGLYLAGFSHAHRAVRLFALDAFETAERRRADHFEYPKDFHPAKLVEGAFGIMVGPKTRVVVRFDASVARHLTRRMWHATQAFKTKKDGAIEMTMTVAGTTEVKSWVLSWGAKAEVIAPKELREEIARELRDAARAYG